MPIVGYASNGNLIQLVWFETKWKLKKIFVSSRTSLAWKIHVFGSSSNPRVLRFRGLHVGRTSGVPKCPGLHVRRVLCAPKWWGLHVWWVARLPKCQSLHVKPPRCAKHVSIGHPRLGAHSSILAPIWIVIDMILRPHNSPQLAHPPRLRQQ
jgi:hypothetical protein